MRGYHIYQTIWDAVVGETLECRRQPLNEHDRYAVAVTKDDVIIGHRLLSLRPVSLTLLAPRSCIVQDDDGMIIIPV